MTILLKGNFGAGSLGDDLLMLASYGVLRRVNSPDQIFVQTVGGNYIDELVREQVWHGEQPPDDVTTVVVGGGAMAPSSQNGTDWMATAQQMVLRHFGVETIQSWQRLWGHKSEDDLRKHIAFCVGLGPFPRGARQEIEIATELSRYALVVVRDPDSMELCRRWRLSALLMNATDAIFLTQYWQGFNATPERPPNYIGVVLGDLSSDETGYLEHLRTTVEGLRADGVYVRYVSFDPQRDQEVLVLLDGEDILMWQPDHMDLDDYLWEFAAFDVVLAGQGHGAIVAACLGIPIVCAGPDTSLSSVVRMLNCPVWEPPYEDASLRLHLGAPQDLSVVDRLRQEAEYAAQTLLDVLR